MEVYRIEKIERDNISSCIEMVLGRMKFFQNTARKESILFYNIKLALWEIFSNFICHGNEKSCKDIEVSIKETEQFIFVKVFSLGNLFEWEGYCNQDCPGVEEERGRGLYILQQICHRFFYEENGQIANMVFMKEDGY